LVTDIKFFFKQMNCDPFYYNKIPTEINPTKFLHVRLDAQYFSHSTCGIPFIYILSQRIDDMKDTTHPTPYILYHFRLALRSIHFTAQGKNHRRTWE
jgi:hypothetical protein